VISKKYKTPISIEVGVFVYFLKLFPAIRSIFCSIIIELKTAKFLSQKDAASIWAKITFLVLVKVYLL